MFATASPLSEPTDLMAARHGAALAELAEIGLRLARRLP
jgi:hypothetical protein